MSVRYYHVARPYHFALALLFILLFSVSSSFAAGDITGWEVGSEYDKFYNYKERDSIKGDIVKFVKVTPLKGMAPGTAFILDEGGGDRVLVHLCPQSFASARETGLRSGEWVKVKGAWADIGDETVFIAAKVKKDNEFSFKVRLTKDGKPFWTMPPDELARERASD
jgi:hypothetical protein